MQQQLSRANKTAWETKAYQAWVHEFGTPNQLAEELKQNHTHHLRYWLKYIGDPAGKRVLNLLGSHGRKAISLALMGADLTVVDISEENRAYATQVAKAAGVQLNYICSDALNIPTEDTLGNFDIVLMEFGILHYFTDLNAIFSVVNRRLGINGRYLLTDFHPFTKVVMSTYNLPNPSGVYFDDTIKEGEVAFAKLLPEEERSGLAKVLTRSWTVGEIVTSLASQGLFIRAFEEIRSVQNPKLPEFYTLVADKIDVQLPPLNP
ncbi:class I SAM-dependent methyltransferase [Alicyclobacillus fastidiosus]|uniref:Class I SAM-dependent methyltransferase n=1 Tax=Alicyclobacillus fastidiosus TaxID=392011 RepID=A0ABY6ZF09_9BACL|nr:class I SAM-dependent methyltransferase [Alicyclobacillus fastidiosus]WAH41431.1 class I SAM-dependent methyltransferase [Alicyclobacillus fastidiosus]GMA63057.1 methyltransferase [Alicyclobacillus fastidiosus]